MQVRVKTGGRVNGIESLVKRLDKGGNSEVLSDGNLLVTSQRLSDLKNSTDQCGFTSNPCTWRSMTTSMQVGLVR